MLIAHGDVQLGIATGKARRGVVHLMNRTGWHDHFVTIQTADDHPSKPAPDMILKAMKETGTEPHRTIMIGDTTYDMQMAKAAGVHAIGVAWGYHQREALTIAGAELVVDDFAHLARAIADFLAIRRHLLLIRPCATIFPLTIFISPEERDPLTLARKDARPPLPKRFYKKLDSGRRQWFRGDARRTRVKRRQSRLWFAERSRGEAIAEEWRAQGEEIDPRTMPLTRLVNSALDGVVRDIESAIADIVRYAGSDLVCYRAAEPEGLSRHNPKHGTRFGVRARRSRRALYLHRRDHLCRAAAARHRRCPRSNRPKHGRAAARRHRFACDDDADRLGAARAVGCAARAVAGSGMGRRRMSMRISRCASGAPMSRRSNGVHGVSRKRRLPCGCYTS